MGKGAWRYASLDRNTKLIKEFCDKFKFELKELTQYQFRIEDVMDVYPVRQRWHWLATDERGHFNDMDDLKRILLEHLPEAEVDDDQAKPEWEKLAPFFYFSDGKVTQVAINGKLYNLTEVVK